MNISEIREKAAPYYACFIARLMTPSGTALTLDEIQESSRITEDESYYLLNDSETIQIAIDFLEEENVVRLVTDEFAPHIVIQHQNFSQNMGALFRQADTIFGKYMLAGDGRIAWLNKALRNIEAQFVKARIQGAAEASDIDDDKIGDVWEPIPLDRNDPEQELAIQTLDRVIEELRGDNGYASTNPEEKAFVQDKLSAVAKRLKEDSQISWMYLLEFAFKPLGIVIKRFGGAAIGITAIAARESLSSWLKSKGISFLDSVFK